MQALHVFVLANGMERAPQVHREAGAWCERCKGREAVGGRGKRQGMLWRGGSVEEEKDNGQRKQKQCGR